MFLPEKFSVNKYQRENIRITDEYVESLSWLTDRDYHILKLLALNPFMTTEQIEMIVFNNLKPSSWRTKANERLRRLYKANCIDRWFPPCERDTGSSQAHYVLDNAGAKTLASKLGYTKKQFKFRKRSYIPQDYKHTLKVMDFYALLHILNRQIGFTNEGTAGEINSWETGRIYKFHYSSNNQTKEYRLIPDAFCTYTYDGYGSKKFFFIEFDNATEPIETLKNKILNYRRFFASGEWRQERWAREHNIFPAILFIFHDQDSVDEMVSYVRRLRSNIRFRFTTYDKLVEDKSKLYVSKQGKKRLVLQERKIKILDEIWNSKDGLVRL